MKLLEIFFFILVILALVYGDCYMHNPRGSNNRLNGRGANTQNQNRLFDSQNNAAGGYCWGPSMYFYQGSQLSIEWTNQHSCGMENTHCDIILQFMCADYIRDGNTTDTIPDNANQYDSEVAPGVKRYGMHEHYDFYQNCKTRQRNGGLFIADRNVNNNIGARGTRQNNNGNRRGFECPEERDYYPYWHPTPWVDIAVLTTDVSRCPYYRAESQNVKAKNYCNSTQFNNEVACPAGQWFETPPHSKTYGCVGAPDCQSAPWNRDNHLGNGRGGYANHYNWTIPNCVESNNCVLRIRYNISSTDYDGWKTFASSNGRTLSPIKQDPYLNFFEGLCTMTNCNLSLAIDTSQFGRTFQDRSHVFGIRKRPGGVPGTARIFNLNVRGKRGNIVQAYPAVEYDFVPNALHVRKDDYIHIQWTGCDTNPQNFAGEGRAGTDRSNFVLADGLTGKDGPGGNLFTNYQDIRTKVFPNTESALYAAYLGQTNCKTYEQLNNGNNDQDPQNCMKLNAASPYIDLGLVKVGFTGTVHYRSTRNNNYTNRSQKGVIVSNPALEIFGVVIVAVGSAAFATAIVFAVIALVNAVSANSPFANVAMFNAGS